MAKWFGFNPPFLSGQAGNLRVLPRQADARLIKNDLIQLLLTAPGERIMRPEFGSQIRPTLFEPIDDIQIEQLRESIKQTIARYEPRVDVTEIRIEQTQEENRLEIKLYGKFNIDRFNRQDVGGPTEDADLLIQLGIPTRAATPGLA